ncbi:hypothetical protein PybrP1_006286 [[Pythium] brassicae (nom. inval.)]|nr:hypothetical protein PybrP1_006286 [[Pythium] brassicae (nom. inval.)]
MIALPRKLHELKTEKGDSVSSNVVTFEGFVVLLKAIGETVDERRQLVVLLGRLPSDYDILILIIKNLSIVPTIEVNRTSFESASAGKQPDVTVRGQVLQMWRGVAHKTRMPVDDEGGQGLIRRRVDLTGVALDSGVSSHKSPDGCGGSNAQAAGIDVVRQILTCGNLASVGDVLCFLVLDRRLLPIFKLETKGFPVIFTAGERVILCVGAVAATISHISNSFHLDLKLLKTAIPVEMLEQSTWDLWYARLCSHQPSQHH